MTSIYHKQENVLREQPEMEKPVYVPPEFNSREQFEEAQYYHNKKVKRYHDHVASIRIIPCSPDCNFIDGGLCEENKDYWVKEIETLPVKFEAHPMPTAIPIQPKEDELWKEFYNEAHKKNLYSFIECYKQKYSITRK